MVFVPDLQDASIPAQVMKFFSQLLKWDREGTYDKSMDRAYANKLCFNASSKLTISGGVIAPQKAYHTVDTEAAAASDDLDTISTDNFSDGDMLILRCEDGAHSVVLKHGTGNIKISGAIDLTLDDIYDSVIMMCFGTNWLVLTVLASVSSSYGDHALLTHLAYSGSGHTGFEPTVTKGALAAGTASLAVAGGAGAVIGSGATISVAAGYSIPTTADHTAWDTAYGWGDHSAAGYYVGTDATIRALLSTSATGLTYDNTTGVLSLTSGYVIPTTTEETNWNTAYGWGDHASAGYLTKTQLPNIFLSSSVTQTIANTSTAYPVTFDTQEIVQGMTHSTSTNTSRITIVTAGTYLIAFSAIFQTGVANKHAEVWLSVDGTNVPRSNTINHMTTANNERLVTVTFEYTFTAGQYFELIWHSDSTTMTMLATPAQTAPTRPACPSIILTANLIWET